MSLCRIFLRKFKKGRGYKAICYVANTNAWEGWGGGVRMLTKKREGMVVVVCNNIR